MPVIEQARCSTCGGVLEVHEVRIELRDNLVVEIDPCEECLRDHGHDGYLMGESDGISEGLGKGFDKGYAQAKAEAEEEKIQRLRERND